MDLAPFRGRTDPPLSKKSQESQSQKIPGNFLPFVSITAMHALRVHLKQRKRSKSLLYRRNIRSQASLQ